MATCTVQYFSNALRRFTTFTALLPNDLPPEMAGDNPHFRRPMKLLILLHGYSGCETDWLYNTPISELAGRYNLAIVLPNGGNGFYLDGPETGRQYAAFVGEELPAYIEKLFGLNLAPADTCIGGFSMGGFGALHTALAYPERFGRVAAFSAALIQRQVAAMTPETQDPIANYAYYRHVFGDPALLPESPNNPEYLVRTRVAAGKPLPRIFFCVGTEDFLYQNNQQFKSFLTEQGVPFRYEEGTGIHDFAFVRSQLEKALDFLTEE